MLNWNTLDTQQRREALSRPGITTSTGLQQTTRGIISQVEEHGDTALLDLTQQFDGVKLKALIADPPVKKDLNASLPRDLTQAIERAYANIHGFHEPQRTNDLLIESSPGIRSELVSRPLQSVGLYVPGGAAPLVSTALMLGVLAQIAQVPRVVLVSPPDESGEIAAAIRYAAALCGITELWPLGGAQAVAALAFGTETLRPVDKIFGPGNRFVTEAKRQVSNTPGGPAIDMPAGPSEVLVLADDSADPRFVAADLLAQAEHGPDSQVLLVSNAPGLLEAAAAEVDSQLATLPRKGIAAQAMEHSRYILVDNLEQGVEVINAYAPEHLIINTGNPEQYLAGIHNAASIFLGPWSPESAGDYASGPNHVLPTYGASRHTSSLSLVDFMKRFTVQKLSKTGLHALAETITCMARSENLDAHARSVDIRLQEDLA